MFRAIVAFSEDPLSSEAANDIIESANRDLAGATPQAGILYVSYLMDPGPIATAIRNSFPGIQLIGCSTEGNISSTGGYMPNGAVLMLFVSDSITIRSAVCRNLSADVTTSVSDAVGEALSDGQKAAFCITLPESLTIGGDAIVSALQHALGKGVSVFGGLSADNWTMDATFQLYNEEVLHDAAPTLIFLEHPALKFSSGVKSGWYPLGDAGIVTTATGNRVEEIDGRPAFDFYRHHFGAEFQVLGEFPLLVKEGSDEYLRAPLLSDAETGAITFAGSIPVGSTVRISTARKNAVIDAVNDAVKQAMDKLSVTPDAAMIFTCAGRHYVLGVDTSKEVDNSLAMIGSDIPVAGFYTFGEIAPGHEGSSVCIHNETFTVVLISETET